MLSGRRKINPITYVNILINYKNKMSFRTVYNE